MQQATTNQRRWRATAGIALPALLMAVCLQSPVSAKEAVNFRNRQEQRTEAPPEQPPAQQPPMQEPVQGRLAPPRVLAGLSEDRIIALVEKRYNAKVVRKEEGSLKGRRVYVLRMMSKDRVWPVTVDAETGKEL
jgi:uncharacterized membrane protein YkoI